MNLGVIERFPLKIKYTNKNRWKIDYKHYGHMFVSSASITIQLMTYININLDELNTIEKKSFQSI